MVSEQLLEEVLNRYDSPEKISDDIEIVCQEQPHLAAFLKVDNHTLLSQEEYSLLWFMTVIIYRAYEEANADLDVLSEEEIGDKEEKIWEIINDSKEKTFRGKLDEMFELCPEEELLAFIEDTLVDDEDSLVTSAGKEFLFVAAATPLFSLCL